jgi:hypothetical protein
MRCFTECLGPGIAQTVLELGEKPNQVRGLSVLGKLEVVLLPQPAIFERRRVTLELVV